MRLVYVKSIYGGNFRVDQDKLENPSGLSTKILWRYNSKGQIVTDKRTHSHQGIARGNIVGPWPGCINDVAAYQAQLDAQFA